MAFCAVCWDAKKNIVVGWVGDSCKEGKKWPRCFLGSREEFSDAKKAWEKIERCSMYHQLINCQEESKRKQRKRSNNVEGEKEVISLSLSFSLSWDESPSFTLRVACVSACACKRRERILSKKKLSLSLSLQLRPHHHAYPVSKREMRADECKSLYHPSSPPFSSFQSD